MVLGSEIMRRFKFDDDKVTPATINDVFEHNFGGDYPFARTGNKVRRMTNAYMLVYIRESERLEILRPVTLDDMPTHLCNIYKSYLILVKSIEQERLDFEEQTKALEEEHANVVVKVILHIF